MNVFAPFLDLSTCRQCGEFADPVCLDPKYGMICEKCAEKLNPQEPETVKTVKVKK